MKVEIDGMPNEFIRIFQPSGGRLRCPHWQCNTRGNASAHSFSFNPLNMIGTTVKCNGHTYKFISK